MNRRSFLSLAAPAMLAAQDQKKFEWPSGKRAAMSITFDDARRSQVDVGLDILDRLNLKATFYLSPDSMMNRLEGWQRAVAAGHEIGNHSMTHPCTANYGFRGRAALEDLTPEEMAADIARANYEISQQLGVTPVSFAYPCGQKFVGRGTQMQSYVPEVAKRFLTGRGYLDEAANNPLVCDMAALMGTGMDGLTVAELEPLVTKAVKDGRWIILVGHEMGKRAYQSTGEEELRWLSEFVLDPANGVWLDRVDRIARHVTGTRLPPAA